MFDHVEGRLAKNEPTRVVVDAGGVGYQCQVPLGTGERLERHDGLVRVYTLMVAQEDLPRLLGFATEEERGLCKLLLKVAGIGPALALSLLSADTPRRLLAAIQADEVAWLQRVKGIGAKTAQRICLEIKDRAATWLASLGGDGEEGGRRSDPVLADAVHALTSLGFASGDAATRVEAARAKQPDADTETLVKAALRG